MFSVLPSIMSQQLTSTHSPCQNNQRHPSRRRPARGSGRCGPHPPSHANQGLLPQLSPHCIASGDKQFSMENHHWKKHINLWTKWVIYTIANWANCNKLPEDQDVTGCKGWRSTLLTSFFGIDGPNSCEQKLCLRRLDRLRICVYTRATHSYTLNCVNSVWNQPSLASSCISPSGGPPVAACTRCRVARSSMASSRLCCGHKLQSEGSNFCPTSRGRTLLGRRAGVSAHRNSTRLTSVDDYFSPARLDYS